MGTEVGQPVIPSISLLFPLSQKRGGGRFYCSFSKKVRALFCDLTKNCALVRAQSESLWRSFALVRLNFLKLVARISEACQLAQPAYAYLPTTTSSINYRVAISLIALLTSRKLSCLWVRHAFLHLSFNSSTCDSCFAAVS